MIKEVDEEFRADKRFKFPIRAHCRQIIPEPEERVKFGNTSNAGLWTILSNFGEPNLADEVMDRGAYHLSNVLTLETKFHDAFMRLELTFKKTDPSVRRGISQILILNLPTNPLAPALGSKRPLLLNRLITEPRTILRAARNFIPKANPFHKPYPKPTQTTPSRSSISPNTRSMR